MEAIMAVVQTLGFPAAMAVALMWYTWKQTQFNNELYKDLKATIDNNTSVIYELKETVSTLKEEVDNMTKE